MEKKKIKKRVNTSILNFFYTIYLAIFKVYAKFEDPDSNRS